MKAAQKIKAKMLREQGYSVNEIAALLSVAKSTVSGWVKGVDVSKEGRVRLSNITNNSHVVSGQLSHKRKLSRLQKAEAAAQDLIDSMNIDKSHELIMLTMLYVGEGNKSGQRVAFINSDPDVVLMFLGLLIRVFKVDKTKIRIGLQLHGYHNVQDIHLFWSKKLDIPLQQFNKPYIKASNHTYTKESYMGCATVTYGNSHMARVILMFAKKLIHHYSMTTTGD